MKLLKEPLIHFAMGGAILFGSYAWLNRDSVVETVEPVTITDGDVRWLVETWRRQWMRKPSQAEVRTLIGQLVEEELLAREALDMGLERDDTVVRRRLAQKLTFLVEDTLRLVEPDEEELRAYHKAHADRFRSAEIMSFTQAFFNPSARPDAEGDARATLVSLRSDARAPSPMGDRLLMEGDFEDIDRQGIAALFGSEFADAVLALGPGVWSGPITSGYGQHLVLVTEKTASEALPFDAVKDQVAAEWWRDREEVARRDYMELLRAKYPVAIDPAVEALLAGGPEPGAALP